MHFWVLPLVAYLQHSLSYDNGDCEWDGSLVRNPGSEEEEFLHQLPVENIFIYKTLNDSAINLTEKLADSMAAVRNAYLTGLVPAVTIRFQQPVKPTRQKPEVLQIEMLAAPLQEDKGNCGSGVFCGISWYLPMPMLNGSVVMHALVKSNGLGPVIQDKSFAVCVNGFLKMKADEPLQWAVGNKVQIADLDKMMSLYSPSRPLWYTRAQAPVLILGGFPNYKIILMTNKEFEEFMPIEVAIDSCWMGTLSCPQHEFSSTIFNAIATESTLFIRQNQLVYYFTGNYSILPLKVPPSTLWTRVLNNVCVEKILPVLFPSHGKEHVLALGGGWQKGEIFLGTIEDGKVSFSETLKGNKQKLCQFLKSTCTIVWALYSNMIVMLVNQTMGDNSTYLIVKLDVEHMLFSVIYTIPTFVPKDTGNGFVMLLGIEKYTDSKLVPKGLSYNPYSSIFFIWGNAILESYDFSNYFYLSEFPKESSIVYFVQSYRAEYVFVTETEEIWYGVEGGSNLIRVYPSAAWDTYVSTMVMKGSTIYGQNESMVTLFYDSNHKLQQLVYMVNSSGNRTLVRRTFPINEVLVYRQIVTNPHEKIIFSSVNYIRFIHPCPFALMRVVNMPPPQFYTRVQYYQISPPSITDKMGFYSNDSLAVYQGLIFQLFLLHFDYKRPYADPVHNPTWRWWKNMEQYSEYFFYLASDRKSIGGAYIDMTSYVKIYDLQPDNALPHNVYLNKRNTYQFSVYLSIRSTKESTGESSIENSLSGIWLTVSISHPDFVQVTVKRQDIISHGVVLYMVTLVDQGKYPTQSLSGKSLMKTYMVLKVVNSDSKCYHHTAKGPQLQGNTAVPLYLGCPPGKRLALDITYTKEHTMKINEHYYDCLNPNPEMPCFFYADTLYPFFLIQDLVTGDSRHFMGSYVFKVIGGGPYAEENIRKFSQEEIYRFNRPHDSHQKALIWTVTDAAELNTTKDKFVILSGMVGISWACQENSPCNDITAVGFSAPDYYFMVEVSNRDVDESTYCAYALEFTLHIHGLPLSPRRAVRLFAATMILLWGLVAAYIFYHTAGPPIYAKLKSLTNRFKENMTLRAESVACSSHISDGGGMSRHWLSDASNSRIDIDHKVSRNLAKKPSQECS